MPLDLEDLQNAYREHLYISGYVLQRYHSGPNGKKLTGKKRPDWSRCYAELRGSMIYRWDAGNYYGMDPDTIEIIKSGELAYIPSDQISKFDPIDIIFTEIRWVGQHSKHTEISNLVVIDGINNSDRTYWNFGNSTMWQDWHAAIEMSRQHRRLILQRYLKTTLKNLPDIAVPIERFDCDMRWAGLSLVDCQFRFGEKLCIKDSRGKTVAKVKKLKELYLKDGHLELFGKFKSNLLIPEHCHYIKLKLPQKELENILKRFVDLDCLEIHFKLISGLKEYSFPKKLQDISISDESMDSSSIEATQIEQSGGTEQKIEELEKMFKKMLPLIVDDAPFDTIPVEFFYKSLMLAWEAAGQRLVPTPHMIATWMHSLTFRMVKIDGRDAWIGIRLKPINYELYRRKREQSMQIEELL